MMHDIQISFYVFTNILFGVQIFMKIMTLIYLTNGNIVDTHYFQCKASALFFLF
jgi:hypothetical protein